MDNVLGVASTRLQLSGNLSMFSYNFATCIIISFIIKCMHSVYCGCNNNNYYTTFSAKSRGFSFKSLIMSDNHSMDSSSLEKMFATARFYHSCVSLLPQMSTDILIGLSCNHKLPSRLWYFIDSIVKLRVKEGVAALIAPLSDRHAPLIMIMCKVTQYLLR